MINKMLICALCILAGTMGGIIFSKRLKERYNYFKNAVNFVDTLISEVSFKKNKLFIVMNDFTVNNTSSFNANINEYLLCENKTEIKIAKGTLTENERYEIRKFFLSLGKSDAHTQLNELENYKKQFAKYCSEAEEKMKKFGGTYIKLGFLAGLALGIILL